MFNELNIVSMTKSHTHTGKKRSILWNREKIKKLKIENEHGKLFGVEESIRKR